MLPYLTLIPDLNPLTLTFTPEESFLPFPGTPLTPSVVLYKDIIPVEDNPKIFKKVP
jgi:hypothetical protein